MNKKLIKYNLKEYRYLMTLYTFLLLVLTTILPIMNAYRNSSQFNKYYNGWITIASSSKYTIIFLVCAFSIITPIVLFNYLNKRSSVDIFHSLPITRANLLKTTIISSYLLVLIPFLIAYVLNNIIFSICAMSSLFTLSWIASIFTLSFMILVLQLPIVYVSINTSSLWNTIIYSGILVVIPLLAVVALDGFGNYFIIGYNYSVFSNISLYFSPFISIFYFLGNNYGELILYSSELSTNLLVVLLYWSIFAAGVYVLLNKNYTVLTTEDIQSDRYSKLFHNTILYSSSSVFFLFCLTFQSFANYDYLSSNATLKFTDFIFPILWTYIFYSVLQSINHRSFRVFFKFTKSFLVFALLLSGLTYGTYVTNFFGYTPKLPELSKIGNLSFTTYKELVLPYNTDLTGASITYSTTDEEKIETITEINKNYLKDTIAHKLDPKSYVYMASIVYSDRIKYSTNTYYSLKTIENQEIGLDNKTILEILEVVQGSDWKFLKENNPVLNVTYDIDNKIYNHNLSEIADGNIDTNELRKIYIEELESMGVEKFYFEESELTYLISYDFEDVKYVLPIDSRFEKTTQYIKSSSLTWEPSNVTLYKGGIISNEYSGYYTSYQNGDGYYGEYDETPLLIEKIKGAMLNLEDDSQNVLLAKDRNGFLFKLPY